MYLLSRNEGLGATEGLRLGYNIISYTQQRKAHFIRVSKEYCHQLWLCDAPSSSFSYSRCITAPLSNRHHCGFASKAFEQIKWWPSLTESSMHALPPHEAHFKHSVLIKPFIKTVFWFVSPLQAYLYWNECVYQKKSHPIHPLQKRIRGARLARLPLADRLRKQVCWHTVWSHRRKDTPHIIVMNADAAGDTPTSPD